MKKKKYILVAIFLITITIIVWILSNTTKKKPTEPIIEITNNQSAQQFSDELPDDQGYAQVIQEINKEYPWYSKLPIENEYYRIIFDFDKKSFRIRLLDQSTEKIKQEALNTLTNIGVDLNKIEYYFIEPQTN